VRSTRWRSACGVTVAENGNERNADDQLHERLEERAARRKVKAALISQRQAHEYRRDKPGVVADNVAPAATATRRQAARSCRAVREPQLCAAGDEHAAEAGWQQHDERGDAQPAGEHLRSHSEDEDQADPEENLVCRHVSRR
jgi:hypothetical protein